ncbi:hypothetical protein ASZ90_011271 [hydrocarbon metagenome]|uniref:Uncharacterized protein n=1 Tax=hydrocarbon metagenome TaxID=938273 RepID=A0A0W8FEI2_9ZZZZ
MGEYVEKGESRVSGVGRGMLFLLPAGHSLQPFLLPIEN